MSLSSPLFSASVVPARAVAILSASAGGVLMLFVPEVPPLEKAGAAAILLSANLALAMWHYQREPNVVRARTLRAQLQGLDADLRTTQGEIEEVGGQKADLTRRTRAEQERINTRRGQIEASEVSSLARALAEQRQAHVAAVLRRIAIDWSSISGIGPRYREALQARGVRTAADIELNNLYGIPGVRLTRRQHLFAWRDDQARRAAASAPTALPTAVEKQIRLLHRRQLLALDAELRALLEKLEQETVRLKSVATSASQELKRVSLERDELNLQLLPLQRVTFKNYLRYVFLFR